MAKEIRFGARHHEMERLCPQCNIALNGAFGVSGTEYVNSLMRPGDLTICAHCRSLSVVTETGLRLITSREFSLLPQDTQEILKTFMGVSDE